MSSLATTSKLGDMLAKFPVYPRGSRWPGLRIAPNYYQSFRVVLSVDGTEAHVMGCKGSSARRVYASINLATGTVEAGRTGLGDLLAELYADPKGFAARHGKLNCMCCFCWSPLSTVESTERGYGPACAKHHGLPWGSI
jgi:uncharacterized protein DUF6011